MADDKLDQKAEEFLRRHVNFDPAAFPGGGGYKIQAVSEELASRLSDLVHGIEVDLDKPLDPGDE